MPVVFVAQASGSRAFKGCTFPYYAESLEAKQDKDLQDKAYFLRGEDARTYACLVSLLKASS